MEVAYSPMAFAGQRQAVIKNGPGVALGQRSWLPHKAKLPANSIPFDYYHATSSNKNKKYPGLLARY
jgi:hypothetical protein